MKKTKTKFLMSSFLWMGVAFLSSQSAQAFSNSFSTEFFKPAVDDTEYFSVYSSPLLRQGNYHFGGWIDYAKNPYEVGNATNHARVAGITDNLITAQLLGTYAIKDWFNAGLRVPIYLLDSIVSASGGTENKVNMGDVELDMKFKLLDRQRKKIGLSALPFVTFPTATNATTNFTGNGNFAGGAKIIADGKIKDRVNLGLNLGVEGRQTYTTVAGNTLGTNLQIGAGVAVDAMKKHLKIIVENQIQTPFNSFFDRVTSPMEVRVGARYRFKDGINANLMGGFGYLNGIASPEYRIAAGVTFTSNRAAEFTIPQPPPVADTYDLKEAEWSEWTLSGQKGELKLREKIEFDKSSANLREKSKPILHRVAYFLKQHPDYKKLKIVGNTCDLGSDKYNLVLSQKRADAVKDYLVSEGVDSTRLETIGLGKSNPVVPNTSEANRELNRRVGIYLEEKN